MTEACNFCKPAIQKMEHDLKIVNEDDKANILMTMLEAIGTVCECGESRMTCYPMIKLIGDYGEETFRHHAK